jgi:16S rRNA (uracil1498-N3)-methyltransferase
MGDSIAVVIGPEGGFSPDEAGYAKERGLIPVTLGKRILRCETAPVCAISAIMFHTDNL